MKSTSVVTLALLTALGLWSNAPAQAAEVTILVNQGAVSGVRDLAAAFEKASGHKVVVDFVGIPQQAEKINSETMAAIIKARPRRVIRLGRTTNHGRKISKTASEQTAAQKAGAMVR